jgi:Domain of unknown function (DUF4158)
MASEQVSPVGKAYPQFHLLTPTRSWLSIPVDARRASLRAYLSRRANRCSVALLLKVLPYLGYVPEELGDISQEVYAFITGQLGLLWDRSGDYPW